MAPAAARCTAATPFLAPAFAVLVDPPFTTEQGRQVADWIRASGKNLTHVIATHGHGDHWFTAPALAEEFGAQVVASQGTIDLMRQQVEQRPVSWDVLFPDQIGETPVTAVVPRDLTIDLEGHEVRIVEVGHSDTEDTTVIHVADLGLVVGGDVIYNGVHQYLAESAGGGLERWLAAVDLVEALAPRLVISGHKNPILDDDASRVIRETREYLTTARALLPSLTTRGLLRRDDGALSRPPQPDGAVDERVCALPEPDPSRELRTHRPTPPRLPLPALV